MQASDIYVTTTIVAMRCPVAGCGVTYGLDAAYQKRREEDGKFWHCPNGHELHYGDTTIARAQREAQAAKDQLARERAQHDQTRARLEGERRDHEHTGRRLRATRGVVTRHKRRIKAGRCVCCSTTFKNLAKHMREEHPNWSPEQHAAALESKS